VVHMFLRFRTAFIKPSTRFFGRGELVTNQKAIAARYLKMDFWIDFLAVLPVPQVGAFVSYFLYGRFEVRVVLFFEKGFQI